MNKSKTHNTNYLTKPARRSRKSKFTKQVERELAETYVTHNSTICVRRTVQ